jgi:hypothetical protein
VGAVDEVGAWVAVGADESAVDAAGAVVVAPVGSSVLVVGGGEAVGSTVDMGTFSIVDGAVVVGGVCDGALVAACKLRLCWRLRRVTCLPCVVDTKVEMAANATMIPNEKRAIILLSCNQ